MEQLYKIHFASGQTIDIDEESFDFFESPESYKDGQFFNFPYKGKIIVVNLQKVDYIEPIDNLDNSTVVTSPDPDTLRREAEAEDNKKTENLDSVLGTIKDDTMPKN